MEISLDKVAKEKILSDAEEFRFCKNREHKEGIDYCFADLDCAYKGGFVLHSPKYDFDICNCDYVKLYRIAKR